MNSYLLWFIVEAAFCHCSFTSSCIKGRFNTTSWLSCLCGWSLASCQTAVATPQGRRFNHCFIEWRQRAHGKTYDGRWYKRGLWLAPVLLHVFTLQRGLCFWSPTASGLHGFRWLYGRVDILGQRHAAEGYNGIKQAI